MPSICGHKTITPGCNICHWCSSCTETGRAYRQRWGEPEPDCTTPSPTIDPAPQSGPSFIKKIFNFGKASVNHVLSGMPTASAEEKEKRLSICASCPHLNQENRSCKVCGCFVDVKAGWADQSCPDKPPRWAAVAKTGTAIPDQNKTSGSVRTTPPPPITKGPGTELTNLLKAMGIVATGTCKCKDKANQMNQWGVEGSKAHRDEIIQWLRDNAAKQSWTSKLKAGAMALVKGVAFHLDPIDPYGSLVDLAIKRAEKEETPAPLVEGGPHSEGRG